MKQLTALIALTILLTACGGGGPSGAEGTAAVQTAVAELLAAQNPPAGETPAAEQPAGEATATPDQNMDSNMVALINSCIPTGTQQVQALVTGIKNGDSIFVEINGADFEVRYIGIDAPDNEGFEQAMAANTQLVEGKTVLLISDQQDVDEYGRLPRYVVVDNLLVNLELVRQGVAFPSSEEPNISCDNAIANAR